MTVLVPGPDDSTFAVAQRTFCEQEPLTAAGGGD